MDRLKQIESFVLVATKGSLTAAAQAEGVAPAVMGRRLDALEARLGVKLLLRTTRKLTLTHEGIAFLEDCQRLLVEFASAEASVSAGGVKASGHLRITAPAGFGRRHVAPLVPTFLARHPEVNAHWLGDRIREHYRVHLGMAVATDDGLIVPVIFDADQKRLSEISREAKELAKLARERKLKPEQYTGSTFSLSNLGMMQIDQFTAIINPPEVAILAVGTAEDQPVVVDGELRTRKRVRVTMSCDHRVVDGAVGARFLVTLRRLIENPLMLVY